MSDPTRRDTLIALGSVAALAACDPAMTTTDETDEPGDTDPPPDCVVFAEQTEGPFYFDPDLERVDIAEGREGVPLELRFAIVDAQSCSPLRDVAVDLWHADAGGAYSGYPDQVGDRDTRGEQWLRGVQYTDANGEAVFRTIWPGWYPGRAVHVHIKLHLDGETAVTTQAYFPAADNDTVEASPAYADRGPRDTPNVQDRFFLGTGQGDAIVFRTTEQGDGSFVASLKMAVVA